MSEYLNSLFSLQGKTALVTGGSRGIGQMMATALVKAGATVYISSRSKEACDAVAAELSALGTCVSMPHDLSSVDGIELLVADITNEVNSLDILINNAGATWGAPLADYPEKAWDKVMTLNVKSPFYLVQKLLPLLEASGSAQDPARIINIGSIAGIDSETLSSYAYMASKAAIQHLTRGLARDLASKNINVTAIAPGFFPSKMTNFIVENDALSAHVVSKIPRGRMGQPDDIGALAIYLSSPASSFMTGNVIQLDGGHLLGNND